MTVVSFTFFFKLILTKYQYSEREKLNMEALWYEKEIVIRNSQNELRKNTSSLELDADEELLDQDKNVDTSHNI